MKIGIIVGARPNFVKAAALVAAFRKASVDFVLIHTGQHSDLRMSEVFFSMFGLPDPAFHLGVSAGGRGEQLGEVVRLLSSLLPSLDLEEVLVVGDVTATVGGALAADACDIPVSHVEAGLRSFDLSMPEERNRRVVDVLAARLFVSEPSGLRNLKAEGRGDEGVWFVGNVMVDTLLRYRKRAQEEAAWLRWGMERGAYAVATLHRPGNVDTIEALAQCLAILAVTARRYPVLFVLHPRTEVMLDRFGLAVPEGVVRLPPLDYLTFISLLVGARVVLTDSGGVQEETTVLGVPCLTMRDNTERPVTCEFGTSRLVGRSVGRVVEGLRDVDEGRFSAGREIPLWDGHAAERIVEIVKGSVQAR